LFLIDHFAHEQLEVFVLRRPQDFRELEVANESSFFGNGVICQGVVVYDAKVVLPWKTIGMLVKVGTQRVCEILLAELVGS